MTDVGRLIEGILCVKCNGKWKRRLCSLEKQATFTNSLRFHVMKRESSVSLLEDVVHAYLWSLDPKQPATIMLICNYRVRCISFDQFEILNNWVEILKTYLTCNYFHADLVLASKESSLHRYAQRRRRQLRCARAQRRVSHTPGASFRLPPPIRDDDGYLHVTRDRICFTTSPGCARPKLLATWSFDNDELVQCCTGRTVVEGGSDADRANLFCLTASPDHPEAPGSHLFISDRANELYQWIEENNQTAVYQAEWRRLTSMAVAAPVPCHATSLPSSFGLTGFDQASASLAFPFGDYVSLFNMENADSLLREQQQQEEEEAAAAAAEHQPCCNAEVAGVSGAAEPPKFEEEEEGVRRIPPGPHQLHVHASLEQPSLDAQLATRSAEPSLQSGSASSASLSALSATEEAKQLMEHNKLDVTDKTDKEIVQSAAQLKVGSPSDGAVVDGSKVNPAVNPVFSNASAQAEFLARKQIAMYSRRRFSSHPIDAHSHGLTGIHSCTHHPMASELTSNSKSVSFYSATSHPVQDADLQQSAQSMHNSGPLFPTPWFGFSTQCNLRRQSDPQLVTIPPFPVPVNELKDFLHRYKCALSLTAPGPPTETSRAPNSQPSAQPSERRLSQCSTVSCANSARSVDSGHLPHLAAECADGVKQATKTVPIPTWRKRLPSSWSTTSTTGGVLQTNSQHASPIGLAPHPHLVLNQSISSSNNPSQFSATPLLPTATLIPGTQHFYRRRKHTASASEALPQSAAAPPLRQRAASIMEPPVGTILRGERATSSWGSGSPPQISLSASSIIPMWADAPVFAKPRTGHNYVLRETLLASHLQRRLSEQQQQQPFPTPQQSNRPPTAGSQATSNPQSGAQLNNGLQSSAVASTRTDSASHSCHGISVETSSLGHVPSGVNQPGLPCHYGSVAPPQHLIRSSTGTNPTSDGQDTSILLSRSYVNVCPPSALSSGSRRIGLQPIAEAQPLLSARTDPLTRLRRCATSSTHCDTDSRTRCCTRSAATVSSCYVNVPHVLSTQTIVQPYVNFPPPTTVGSSPHPHQGPRPSSMDRCSFTSVTTTPSTSTLSNRLPSTAVSLPSPGTGTDSTSAPRLHYALLTLSASSNRPAGGEAAPAAATQAKASTALPPPPTLVESSPLQVNPSSSSSSAAPVWMPVAVGPSRGVDNTDDASPGLNYVTIDMAQTKALSELEQELRSSTLTSGSNVAGMTISVGDSRPSSLGRAWRIRSTLRRGWSSTSKETSAMTGKEIIAAGHHSPPSAWPHCTTVETAVDRNPSQPGNSLDSKRDSLISFPTRILTRLVRSLHTPHHHSAFGRRKVA